MSYLGTLVNTPPAASAPRRAEPGLERHVEVETAAPPIAAARKQDQDNSAQRSVEQAQAAVADAAPTASVEDALRAAFEWVTPKPVPTVISAEVPSSAPIRNATPELRSQSVAVPMEAAQTIDAPQATQPLERHDRSLAMPAASQAIERIDIASEPVKTIELTTFESTPTLEAKPRRQAVASRQAPAREAESPDPQTAASPPPVQVHIGTISLNVRTPTPPAPAAKPAAPVVATAPPTRPAPSAGFAFSARRHHLRWG